MEEWQLTWSVKIFLSKGQLPKLLAILDFVLFLLCLLMLSEGVSPSSSSGTWRTEGTSKSYHGLVAFLRWSAYTLSLLGALVVSVDALLLGHVHKLSRCVLRLHLAHDI